MLAVLPSEVVLLPWRENFPCLSSNDSVYENLRTIERSSSGNAVFRIDVLVGRRVQFLNIHATHNTGATGQSEDIVEFNTFPYSRDKFLCIVWAHRDNPIRLYYACLRPVYLPSFHWLPSSRAFRIYMIRFLLKGTFTWQMFAPKCRSNMKWT